MEHYYSLGVRGAKFLQNYWGIDLNDEKYIPYFEKLVELNIPLIVHIGNESSVSSRKESEHIDMLQLPLKVGVTVIAAHMGIGYELWKPWQYLSTKPSNLSPMYHQLLAMLETHDNLYADLSAILTPVRANVLPHLSKQTHIHHKILFATDFPVPFTVVMNSYDLSLRKRIDLAKIDNPFDRYIEILWEYFGKESDIFKNHKKLLGGK
jgi:predicted TIM-barrel fold metal-dependent hydrolase